MAKVATHGALTSTSLQIGGDALKVGPTVKRKTPSELRGEQLKNAAELVNKSFAASEMDNGLKKPDLPRNPRYIDTRMDEVYPAKKSRFKLLAGKENTKENSSVEQPSSLKKISVLSNLAAKRRQQLSCPESSVAPDEVPKDDEAHAHRTLQKCSQGTFLSVTELSSGGPKASGLASVDMASVDMDKALKGLAAREAISDVAPESSERVYELSPTGNFCSEFHVVGQKIPLDLTLKTYMRLVSSSSVNWLNRLMMCGTYNGMPLLTSQSGSEDQNFRSASQTTFTSQDLDSKALHSWIYPQSTLPLSLMSILASAADGVEADFLRKRLGAWEESFRSLYYMFRHNVCSIFYVCISNFVVMFTAADGSGRSRRSCHAYISQSSRSLRSLLKEHDVSFSMPLCRSQVEQVTTEDLVELSEIEKHNLGQARWKNSFSDVDNTPQSLLAFSGNENVHGLFEILLNYRSFLTFLNAADVPVLYSPVPFQNAALSAPEVRCMEIKRADQGATLHKVSPLKDGDLKPFLSNGLCYSVEIKDSYIPPWIISNICAVMASEGKSFEASFTTEHTSVGLNIALEAVCEKVDSEATVGEDSQEIAYAFGIPQAIVSPYMPSGLLKGLNFCDGSYTASLSPV